jgi:hypothetical protein
MDEGSKIAVDDQELEYGQENNALATGCDNGWERCMDGNHTEPDTRLWAIRDVTVKVSDNRGTMSANVTAEYYGVGLGNKTETGTGTGTETGSEKSHRCGHQWVLVRAWATGGDLCVNGTTKDMAAGVQRSLQVQEVDRAR